MNFAVEVSEIDSVAMRSEPGMIFGLESNGISSELLKRSVKNSPLVKHELEVTQNCLNKTAIELWSPS